MREMFIALVLLLTLTSCGGGQRGDSCFSSANCAEPLECIHYRDAYGSNFDKCFKPCTAPIDCSEGESCMCPDSPTGDRCRSDGDGPRRYCEPYGG